MACRQTNDKNSPELSSDSELSDLEFLTASEFDSASESSDLDDGEEKREKLDRRRYTRKKKRRLEDVELPQWFIDHCVISASQWKDRPESLVLRKSTGEETEGDDLKGDTVKGDATKGDATKGDATKGDATKDDTVKDDTAKDDTAKDKSENALPNENLCEIDDIVFQQLQVLVRSNDPLKDNTNVSEENYKRTAMGFTTEIVHLNFDLASGKQKSCCHQPFCFSCPKVDISLLRTLEKGMTQFYLGVIEHFARAINADLVIIRPYDLKDLLEYSRKERGLPTSNKTDPKFDGAPSACGISRMSTDSFDYTLELPTAKIALSGRTKRSPGLIEDKERDNPLTIIYLAENLDILKSDLLKELRFTVKSTLGSSQVLFVVTGTKPSQPTDCSLCGSSDYERDRGSLTQDPQSKPTENMPTKIQLAPPRSTIQEAKLQSDTKLAHSTNNVRSLKRVFRRHARKTTDLLDPYAEWTFLKDSAIENLLQETTFDESVFEFAVPTARNEFTDEDVKDAILQIPDRKKALEAWDDFNLSKPPRSCTSFPPPPPPPPPPLPQSESKDDEWSSFPPAKQNVIRDIVSNRTADGNENHSWEMKYLPFLVKPKDALEGWNDIAIDPSIKKLVEDITGQQNDSTKPISSYGLLGQGHVGGALIYGPPGTGKTHLARVLARESPYTVVCASPADIQNKWLGETPKAIRGLFSLARKLTPCIVFIDEADTLLKARNNDSLAWEISQVNQFLAEMDGISKSKTAPFVLLSTNFPGDLDSAVLRRVPSHIHIGLPSTRMRERIFQIVLKDEILDGDIDFMTLALMTPRYSGSDIRNFCYQAALMCTKLVQDGEDKGKRILGWELFQRALERTSPTVAKSTLSRIKTFAASYDALGLRLMQEAEMEESEMLNGAAPMAPSIPTTTHPVLEDVVSSSHKT